MPRIIAAVGIRRHAKRSGGGMRPVIKPTEAREPDDVSHGDTVRCLVGIFIDRNASSRIGLQAAAASSIHHIAWRPTAYSNASPETFFAFNSTDGVIRVLRRFRLPHSAAA